MNKAIGMSIAFLLGASAGAASAWYILKERYAKIAQEEIDSVKETFSKLYGPDEEKEDGNPIVDISDDTEPEEPARATNMLKHQTDDLIEKLDYTSYSSADISETHEDKEVRMEEDHPYIITPEEFGVLDDYEQIDLTFFSDQIVADDELEIVEDLDRVIGFESLNHFGEYSENTIFVRNDRLKCDYEVNTDERTYAEAVNSKPRRMGVL